MQNEFDRLADQMLGGRDTGDLQALAASEDGQRLKERLGGGEDIRRALETGDSAALQEILSSILRTEEGARMAKQLEKLMQ